MKQDEAIKFLEQLADQIYKQGTVTMTPQAHQVFCQAIEALRPKESKKTK